MYLLYIQTDLLDYTGADEFEERKACCVKTTNRVKQEWPSREMKTHKKQIAEVSKFLDQAS